MQFSQVIGQRALGEKMRRMARAGRVSHAQLLTGADGRGALALAAAYAQYLNCEQPTEQDSCGLCHNCRKYKIVQHPDLHFSMPAAWSKREPPTSGDFAAEWQALLIKNRYPTLEQWYAHISIEKQGIINVAEAQNIIRTLTFKPYEGKYKVQIIWHAERMREDAANKLLKLIEEPPPATLLLLAAPSADNIIRTILSRCQQIAVPPIDEESVAAALISQKHLAQDKASEIARLCGGDYAEAMAMAAPQSGREGFLEKFIRLLNICQNNSPEHVIALLLWADEVNKAYKREQQKQFLSFALMMVREVFMAGQSMDATPLRERIAPFAQSIHRGNAQRLYDELNLAYGQIAANGNARMIFTDLALKVIKYLRAR